MSQPCTPTKFPASPAQLITLALDDKIDGCALGEVLPHHLQVPSEERILDQQIPALQWLQAAVLASLADWAQAALTVVVPRPYMPRVFLLIQLLLIQLQQALCGRAEGKGAVHHREQQDKSEPYSKQAAAGKSLLSKAMSFAGSSWVPAPQCLAGFRHRPDSPSINSPAWQLTFTTSPPSKSLFSAAGCNHQHRLGTGER